MNLLFITPGTGSFYCGVCLRDNALVRALCEAGHEAWMLPMYLPLAADEDLSAGGEGHPIFYGGINTVLQQLSPVFRKTPRWLDGFLDAPWLLRMVARASGMTGGPGLGPMTLSMLRGEEGNQAKELNRLLEWLERHPRRPDVACLSTALQAGLTPALKDRLGMRTVVFFQGEDGFLDSFDEPHRSDCWQALGAHCSRADLLVAPSRFYADFMAGRLGLPPDSIRVMPNGVSMDGLPRTLPGINPEPGNAPVIGYLARMSREKGLDLLVDAFVMLTRKPDFKYADGIRLAICGAMTKADSPYVAEQRAKLERAGLRARVTWLANAERSEKIAFLRGLDVFSVPARYREGFGLYLAEAMAAGVPVVQPDHAAFPEVVGDEAGWIYAPHTAEALADKLARCLSDRGALERAREAAHTRAWTRFTSEALASRLVAALSPASSLAPT